LGEEVVGGVAGDAAHGAGVDRYKDDFADLDDIVGPQAIGFAEDRGIAVISQNDTSEGVGWFDMVHIYECISVVVASCAAEVIGGAAFVPWDL
jgi:hypothetical protein